MSKSFGNTLRSLRNAKKKSQLDLALDAGISSKHLSFLESGRALPGKEIVRKLTEALEISDPYKNTLFLAAGFSSDFEIVEKDEPMKIEPLLIKHINGLCTAPTMVVSWDNKVLKVNSVLERLIAALKGKESTLEGLSAYEFMFGDRGLGHFLLENRELEDRIITCGHLENSIRPVERSTNRPDPELNLFNKTDQTPITIRLEYNGILIFDVLHTASGHPFEVNARSNRIYSWVPSDGFTENTMRDLICTDSELAASAK
ncbi:helix-turn-helix domain-containing protein [Leptospira sp. 201903071]|uniref:XRE family transcriptional regulator n=1 Tax=Leptospira ainazelensis TaxID=2810034 RepID=UPI0019657070|nr:XRE family transcriptional regulator [Leptospira ainazelensis]MBM9501891.1 helix-turn-helix domain-containing protein [Leptospira ainazelensis]